MTFSLSIDVDIPLEANYSLFQGSDGRQPSGAKINK